MVSAFPVSLGLFDGLSEREAGLTLVLGAYHAEQDIEQLYEEVTVEVLVSANLSDSIPPTIDFTTGDELDGVIQLEVKASDDSEIIEVVTVCDDGQGSWHSTSLVYESANEL